MADRSSVKRPFEAHENEGHASKRSSIASETVFRLLVDSKKVGSVIGKAGSVIKALREETGAKIKVLDAVVGCEDRVILIAGIDDPSAPFSTAQEALFRTQQRLCDLEMKAPEGSDSIPSSVTTKMLVYGSQAGCLIGKGGEIIKMIREGSGASVRVLSPDEVPICAEPTDRVVQLTGEVSNIRTCLQMISKQLRENPPRETRDQPQESAQAAYRGGMPGGMHEPYGMQPQAPYHQQYQQQQQQQLPPAPPPLPIQQNYGTASQDYLQQGFQAMGAAGGYQQMPTQAYPPAPLAPPTASTTQVSSKMTIPNLSVGAVIGKGGSNISQVRQISGARVKVHEMEQGSQERVLEITGTNEQVMTAQQLVQAFITNNAAPAY